MKIMKFLPLFFFLITVGSFAQNPLASPGEDHLRNIKQLTFGGENAEAYLSFDEKRLVFQSTRDSFHCDQIFVMDTNGENVQLISGGVGRTTCAYFLPGDNHIVYASTIESGASCPPPPDRSKGYVWKLYESFDIYASDLNGGNLKKLTDSPGYDAEATVSPMGDKIVFTSLRDGDPELYLMDLDGSNQTRLTFEKGYDGGAFFSQDGKQLVFRASRPKTEKELEDYRELVEEGYVRPTALEIFVIDVDGKNMRQVTSFGKASFAPYFHPDGKRIIFSSNLDSDDPRNFDLYIINTDGTGLKRITNFNSFDGFPMFTRDGKHLVFASNRNNSKPNDTNIFIAEWAD